MGDVTMAKVLAGLVAVFVVTLVSAAADVDPEKLRVKQLKEILLARGVQCKGCVEKSDFVKRVKETADVKELPAAPPKTYYELGQVKEIYSHQVYLAGLAKHRDETGLPVIVDYFSHSCGPCIQIAPIFEEMAREYAGRAVFWKIDVNRNHESSAAAGVRSMPTFQFFLNNVKQHEFSGGDPSGLQRMTEQLVNKVESEGGPWLHRDVSVDSIKAFYEKHKDKVGSKADPEAIAKKYKNKAALLTRHFKAKYGDAPVAAKIKYRPRTKDDDKKPASNQQEEQKCASV